MKDFFLPVLLSTALSRGRAFLRLPNTTMKRSATSSSPHSKRRKSTKNTNEPNATAPSAHSSDSTARFSIDRGGTFTDVHCQLLPSGRQVVTKLLSRDPANYEDAPTEGIRRILRDHLGVNVARGTPQPFKHIDSIRMGTTVATNALLERQGAKCALVVTHGFGDALQIGNQARPNIFDLRIERPDLLYGRVIEVDERVRLARDDDKVGERGVVELCEGSTGERVAVLRAPDLNVLRARLRAALDDGFTSVAVVFVHAYTFSRHEEAVGSVCAELGFEHVSMSHRTMRMVKFVPRGQTACVDAYLTPLIEAYLRTFRSGFDNEFDSRRVSFMMSDGGLCVIDEFSGYRAILSGPAGGVVGYSRTAYTDRPLIGFDMGGTSTDVSRFAGSLEHVFETLTAGVPIMCPQLDIQTVAAGGGSRLFFRQGLFVVGPESVGAHPGPVCYRKGGSLAVTDANLVLGRLLPHHFPCIFGPNEDEPLDVDGARAAFETLTAEINEFFARTEPKRAALSVEQVALGFITVANEAMCRPIRNLTEAKGHRTSSHALACFGGAGPQHACAVARALGMQTVLVHRYAGILSAFGLRLADVVYEAQEAFGGRHYTEAAVRADAQKSLTRLEATETGHLRALGYDLSTIKSRRFLNLRYDGTDTALMVEVDAGLLESDADDRGQLYVNVFEKEYQREFGFLIQDRDLVIDDVRVRVTGHSDDGGQLIRAVGVEDRHESDVVVEERVDVYFEVGGLQRGVPVYHLDRMPLSASVDGPCMVIVDTCTIVVEPLCRLSVDEHGNVRIDVDALSGDDRKRAEYSTDLDLIQLSVFSHRFMSIAEQMGRTLQRTAMSVNIKERLDFSCALFAADGSLVANAPHLPVHLGAMQEAVRYQIELLGDDWKEGDVIVSNDPTAGGSHLPDITVMTPVYADVGDERRAVFYVASRGHHSDIGGISPGSMPPFSRRLAEEGACIRSYRLVRGSEFAERGIVDLLNGGGVGANLCESTRRLASSLESCSGTRQLRDNLSDLKAQVAANQRGIQLMGALIAEYSVEVVLAYMHHVQETAERAVRAMLRRIYEERNLEAKNGVVQHADFMDDGSKIALKLTIDEEHGTAEFDFAGTSLESLANCNAPRAVTYSAIIYALRCLVKEDIPLNSGCMRPITVKIPQGSLLWPSEEAAVVGGNVLTSQRVTDVVLSAMGACACSQGCMNNLTFGHESMGYYETIGGGAGAGADWQGADGVQVHMTNTRITDVEVLERRYPVMLRRFSLRHGSGGDGLNRGGLGLVRCIEFLAPLSVGILSERRALSVPGMAGGGSGRRGVNLLRIADTGAIINVGGKNSFGAGVGDRFCILTPGGGGYGRAGEGAPSKDDEHCLSDEQEAALIREYFE